MHSRGRSMSPVAKRSRSRTRSRSPLKRSYDNKTRDGGRSRGRQVRDKECRVYVSNLNYDMKWMELKDIMKKVGPVEHVEVFTDGEGRSKGCAVVEFSHSKDAHKAINDLDGSEMQGRKVKVREDIMDDTTYREQLKTQKDKSRNFKESHSNFDTSGVLLGSNLLGSLSSGFNAGIGTLGGISGIGNLIGGGTQTSQLQLLSMLNSKGGEPINSTVFVSNLDYDLTWQKLKDIMRRAGNCLRCDILQDDNNRSKGYGTVVFETPMEALSSVALFNGFEAGNSRRQISVRLDRNSPVHQILGQLGISSTDITQRTLQQLQQVAALAVLTATGGGGLGGVGGLGALGGLSALTGSTNAYGALQNQAGTQGNNLGQLGGLGNLGLAQQLQGLGGLLQNRGTGSSSLTGGVGSTNTMLGSSYGLDSSATIHSSYGLQSLASLGGTAGSVSNGMRGFTSTAGGTSNISGGTRVFVRNLPFSFTWQNLKDKFRDAGRVQRADIKTDEKQRSKGCGTVTFESSSDAARAIALFNGSRVEGREIEVRLDRY